MTRWQTSPQQDFALCRVGSFFGDDTISGPGVPGRSWVSFTRNFPQLVPLSPSVVRRVVDRLDVHAYDRLYTLGGDAIDHDAKQVVHRCTDSHVRWASGEFDHLT